MKLQVITGFRHILLFQKPARKYLRCLKNNYIVTMPKYGVGCVPFYAQWHEKNRARRGSNRTSRKPVPIAIHYTKLVEIVCFYPNIIVRLDRMCIMHLKILDALIIIY